MTNNLQLRRTAIQAMREGRLADAIAAYRMLLAAEPSSADSWYNLAYLLRCVRDYESALAAYAKALDCRIGRPEEIHLNRAVILSEYCERNEEAAAELRRALALAPGFTPAWLNLAMLHEDGGALDEAREAYRQVIALDPGNGRAQARLAALDIVRGQAAAAISRLQRILALGSLAPVDAAEIGFALGSALDAEERYDEAFAAFAEANRHAMGATPPSHRYDRQAHERLIDELIAMPIASDDGLRRAEGEIAPIFVCGMFRSGSTLIERILSRHSRITSGGELEILPAFAADIAGYPATLPSLSSDARASLRSRYLAEARSRHPHAGLLTDKRPDNFLHVGLIKRLFPDAPVIHTVRDPLDTMLSVYFLYFDDSVSYGHDLGDIAHWYGQYRRLMRHWHAAYPDGLIDLSYDALVADPRAVVGSLLSACGIAWEEATLTPEAAGGTVRTASAWQVRQQLYRRSSGRWRNYAAQIAPLRRALEDAGIVP